MSRSSATQSSNAKRKGRKIERLEEKELDAVSAGGSYRNPQSGISGNSETEVAKEVDRTSVPIISI